VNGFQLDFSWKNRQVDQLSILSTSGAVCKISLPEGSVVKDQQGKVIKHTYSNGVFTFNTKKGSRYTIVKG
jgi:alpha-L-fucosidase 2